MRAKKIHYFVGVILLAILTIGVSLVFSKSHGLDQGAEGLTLEVKPAKGNYLPGELITITCKVINKSSDSIPLFRGSTVRDGYLKILIADEKGSFKEYFGPGWGTKDADYDEPITLGPEQAFETEATVLWNQKLETAHLNRDYAEKLSQTRIPTNYALPTYGVYYLKAVLHNPLNKRTIESEPVRLVIEPPQGSDLEVWNKIKDDGEYALFMQTGGLAETPTGAKTKEIAKSLESLLQLYPDNHYSKQIVSSLDRRQAAIERRPK